MAELDSNSHAKLIATPTSGLPGEHSPYYRRLLSAGYKGLIQGNLGGATLYGVLGGAVGFLAGVSLYFMVPTLGSAAFFAIPILAAYGTIKGFDTFGMIGSHAAIQAEAAEINERRRGLQERLQETSSLDEATEIKRLLQAENKEDVPKQFLHWKTVLFGALIGAVLLGGLALCAHAGLLSGGIATMIAKMGGASALEVSTTAAAAIGAIMGAAVGVTAGIDRFYVRRWFDVFEHILHDREHYLEISRVRQNETSQLQIIANKEKERGVSFRDTAPATDSAPDSTPAIATNTPASVISKPEDNKRVHEHLLRAPAV